MYTRSRFLRLASLVLVFCYIFGNVFLPVFAETLPKSELKALDEFPNWVGLCGSEIGGTEPDADGVATAGSVYIMGDSITNLAKASYLSKFKDPWSVTVEGLDKRHIATSPPSPSGLDQLDEDKGKIAKAKAIVIALGSNDAGSSEATIKHNVQKAISKIKRYRDQSSSAPIFWVNVLDTRPEYKSKIVNKAIKEGVGNDANVIDWYSEAKDKADLDSFTGGVHPTKQKDKELLVNLVYDTVTKSEAPAKSAEASSQPKITEPPGFTLKEKIGQLLFVGVTDNGTAASLASKYQIGGILLNTGSTYSKSSIDDIKKAGKIPVLIAADEEGGKVDRLNFNTPSAKELGKLSDTDVKKAAIVIGKKLAELSIDVDFAPVVDLDNGHNSAISAVDRSFSNNPSTVTRKAGAFADGLKQSDIIPTFKHFPGLGNATGSTGGNTDTGSATTPSLSDLEKADLKPYKTLLKSSNQTAVMMGNQNVPGLTDGDPASMSKKAYDLLHDDYGFDGVVITDEIADAKSVGLSPSQAVIKALKAGADMPLFNTSGEAQVAAIINDVAQAVNNNTLDKKDIDSSFSKVLRLKNKDQAKKDKAEPSCQCNASSDNTSLSGKDRVEQAFNFFHQTHGLSVFVSAAIVGTLQGESGDDLDPAITNGIGAHGIAQWTDPPYSNRRPALKEFAKKKNPPTDENDFATQLEFVWSELKGGYKSSLQKLKTEHNIETAVYNFESTYEVSGHGNMDARYAGAKRLIHAHGGDENASGSAPESPDPSANLDCASGSGSGTPFVLDDYAWPVDINKSEVNSGYPWPCKGNCHHDGTPAFDLSTNGAVKGNDATAVGKAEYAITDGTIENLHIYMGIGGCYIFQLKSSTDGYVYAYIHSRKPTVAIGDKVKAGDKVAEIGARKCTGNDSYPHLHIDRGAPKGHFGGSPSARDPGMVDVLNKLYESLPD